MANSIFDLKLNLRINNDIKKEVPNIKHLPVNDFLQMATIINNFMKPVSASFRQNLSNQKISQLSQTSPNSSPNVVNLAHSQ